MAQGLKTGGRKKGTPNKATLGGQAFVEAVRAELAKRKEPLTPEAISASLLASKNEKIVQRELQSLRELEYGRPTVAIAGPAAGGTQSVYVFDSSGGVARK